MNAENAKLLLEEEFEEQEFFEEATSAEVTDTSRWSTFYKQVFEDTRDGSFWQITWSRGSTEMQDEGFEDVSVKQVWPRQKTIWVYQ